MYNNLSGLGTNLLNLGIDVLRIGTSAGAAYSQAELKSLMLTYLSKKHSTLTAGEVSNEIEKCVAKQDPFWANSINVVSRVLDCADAQLQLLLQAKAKAQAAAQAQTQGQAAIIPLAKSDNTWLYVGGAAAVLALIFILK